MLDRYLEGVKTARTELQETVFLKELLSGNCDRDRVENFWLWFCARGTRITAPVEGWIRRAGERCTASGYADLGAALVGHAKGEAGHDKLMRDDAYTLAAWRRGRGLPAPDDQGVATMLADAPTVAMLRYIELHELVIAGPQPFAQIAIEYEIEKMSRDDGPRMLKASEVKSPGVGSLLSFVNEHVALDQGHTAFNEGQLKRLLAAHPEALPTLVDAGREAISSYAAFFEECWAQARLPW